MELNKCGWLRFWTCFQCHLDISLWSKSPEELGLRLCAVRQLQNWYAPESGCHRIAKMEWEWCAGCGYFSSESPRSMGKLTFGVKADGLENVETTLLRLLPSTQPITSFFLDACACRPSLSLGIGWPGSPLVFWIFHIPRRVNERRMFTRQFANFLDLSHRIMDARAKKTLQRVSESSSCIGDQFCKEKGNSSFTDQKILMSRVLFRATHKW